MTPSPSLPSGAPATWPDAAPPPPATWPLIGRDELLRDLSRSLVDGNPRAVVLVGLSLLGGYCATGAATVSVPLKAPLPGLAPRAIVTMDVLALARLSN